MDTYSGCVDDLATLSELEELSLLQEIHARYNQDKIYTYIGDILIAVNPYRRLPIYGQEKWQLYREVSVRSSLPPHIYAVSDSAYQNLRNNQVNQCCVVSGESGAGKTESTKLLIEHIAQLCRHDTSDLHTRIVQVNPLLEAFGNAQTVINNNSSRFGKYIELVFNQDGQIQGAKISEYLLEKSRVVLQSAGERNFHIFYYLFAGLDESERQANLLNRPEDHRIIRPVNGSSVFTDNKQFQECKSTWEGLLGIMKFVGFKDDEFDGILAVLAAILHITDIEFVEDEETDGVFIHNEELPSVAAQLLLVKAEDLVSALISNVSTVGMKAEKVMSLKNMTQASDGRDALAKALYGRLFGWIVRQINTMLKPTDLEQAGSVTIGILDIYGFENVQNNSFEQLCINVTNEQLQYYFNQHIFKSELEEYEREGVPSRDVSFVDNLPLIELFLEPQGLFAKLDDESKFPQGSDQSLVDKMRESFATRPEFQSPKGNLPEFMITHFAGLVTYLAVGFLEKNRDTLGESIMNCMKRSDSRFVADLFSPVSELGALESNPSLTIRRKEWRMSKLISRASQAEPNLTLPSKVNSSSVLKRMSALINEGGDLTNQSSPSLSRGSTMRGLGDGAARPSRTLASHFKNSLCDLLDKLTRAQPHFIRCIKPNAEKAAQMFDDRLVLQQLRYTGVLETVKIRKQGYSARIVFSEFTHRFSIFSFKAKSRDDKEGCAAILRQAGLKDWQMGKTKVFLKYYHMEKLNEMATQIRRRVAVCQAYFRGALVRLQYEELKVAAQRLNELIRVRCEAVAAVSNQLYTSQDRMCNEDEALRTESLEKKIYERHPEYNTDIVNPSAITTLTVPQRDPSIRAGLPNVPHLPTIAEHRGNPAGFGRESMDPSTVQVLLDETTIKLSGLSTEIWGKVYYLEKNAIMGKVYLRDWEITMDDSSEPYDGQVIGINTFDHWGDPESSEAIDNFGQGIRIGRDEEGNIYITKLTSCDVFVKEFTEPNKNCFAADVFTFNGRLTYDPMKVFDISVYKQRVAAELQRVDFDPHMLNRLSVIKLSIWKDRPVDVETPCWICIINFTALDLLGKDQVFKELKLKLKSKKDEAKILQKWKQLDYNRLLDGLGAGAISPNKTATLKRNSGSAMMRR